MLPSSLYCDLLLLTGVLADFLVAPRVVNSVNYDDYTLLCADGIPLLMEDHRPRPCQPRPWLREQKCPVGFWCHEGDDESSYYCCPANRKLANRCHLPPATGHGNKAMRRFYYDWSDDGCHELIYTGVGGNENSFTSYDQCEKACRGVGEPSVKLPKDSNPLKNKKVDKSSSTVPSIISEQRGRTVMVSTNTMVPNPSDFVTMKTSKSTSTATAPPAPSTVSTATVPTTTRASIKPTDFTTTTPKRHPDPTTSQVTISNEVEDTTRWTGSNPCDLPMDQGVSGGVAQKMWYFDGPTLTCQPFTYLGSGGNANRFSSNEDCKKVCGSGFSGKPSPEVCNLQPQFGNGTYKIPRYFYDQLTKHCELFFYSGKGGNENRFLRKQKCERYCVLRKNKKYSTPVVTTTMSTRPATRIVQELQASREWSSEPSTTTTTSTPLTQATTQAAVTVPSTMTPSTVTTVAAPEPATTDSYPTLITFPKEFIPPFPQFTFSPVDPGSTTTAPTPLHSEGPFKPNELVDSLFEHLMASTPPAPITSSTPSMESTKKSHFPSLIIVPKDWDYSKHSGSSEILGAATVTATPLIQYPVPWRTSLSFEKVIKPSLPVMGVVETRVETPMLPSPVITSGTSFGASHNSNGMVTLPEGVSNSNGNAISLPKELRLNINKGDHAAGVLSFSKPVYLAVNNNTNLGATLSRTDYLSVNNRNTDEQIMLPNPAQLSANSQAVVESGPTQNPEWVGHGLRAYQQILQEKERTSSPAPVAVEIVTNSNSITTTQPSATNSPVTENVVVPVVEVNPKDFAVHSQSTSMEIAGSSRGSNNTVTPTISPCTIPTFGNVVIMCELDEVTCPTDTFCQIGEGQSICCPKPPEPKCSQALRPGVGASVLLRWHFNAETQLCLPFAFRGFQGNENNFDSLASCKLACLAPKLCDGAVPVPALNGNESCSTSPPNSCPNGYTCKASEDGKLSACCPEATVLPQKTTTPTGRLARSCVMEQDAGYGVESSHRWSFDPKSSNCVSFIYNGHGGNQNNFLSRGDCESACKTHDPCNEPVVSGTGNNYISRFFYSKEYGQCLHFVYSGEGGNTNNFANLKECMDTCMSDGVQFNSHATVNEPKFAFTFVPRPVCPHGDVPTLGGQPITCDALRGTGCPAGNVCTSMDLGSYCCRAPESFCLQPRPALSVCLSPNSPPVQRIEFTYDPLADRCVQFTYSSCSPSLNLNHFTSSLQCKRLCCNQGYDLVYRKRLLHMSDSPMEVFEELQKH